MKETSNGVVLLSALGIAACACVNSSAVSAETGADRQAPDGKLTSAPARLEEIVVTGSRLKSTSIDGPVPVTVFDRQKLDQLGATTLSQALSYLPEQPYLQPQSATTSGAQSAEIRGLGMGSTLVLINGRRVVPSAAGVTFNYFDLNTIPMAAVERVEVLAESASAVYGADALGGVINVILKKNIPAPVLDLRYGTASGGGAEKRASLSAGSSGEHWTASVILDYFDQESLRGAERYLLSHQDFRRFGGTDFRSTNTNPGNIRSLSGDNLPGLPNSFAAVPVGSAGIDLTADDFIATAGKQNLGSLNSYRTILPEIRRISVAGFAEVEISPHLQGFAELLYVDRDSDYPTIPSQLSGTLVPATNAFNPFGEAVRVNYLFSGIGSTHTIGDSEFMRALLGLRGAWGNWDWEFSALRSEEESNSEVRNAVDMARVNAALASSDPAQALNVFQDGPGGSPELLASLVAQPAQTRYGSNSTMVNAFARGTLFDLPAGPVSAVIGAEWRQETIQVNTTYSVDEHRNASAGYAELRLPIVAGDQEQAHAVTMTLAARYDHYSDFGNTFNPQAGVTWKPAAEWLLRAGYGQGFRAPSLYELYSPRRPAPLQIEDLRRNGELVSLTAITGGNPELEPIRSEFASAGIVWTPRTGGNWRVSADFWQIKLDQRVTTFAPTLLLVNESSYPSRIVRAAPTPEDAVAGLPGQLLSMDLSKINYGRLDTNGIDLKTQWSIDSRFGRWTPSVAATWIGRYKSQDLPDTPETERVGRANLDGSITRWRAVGTLAWTRDRAGLSAAVRYTPSYEDVSPFTNEPVGRAVPAQAFVDLQGSLDFTQSDSWLSGFKLSAGIVNLFDKEPSFAVVGYSGGSDPTQSDLRQRYFYAQLSKRF